MPGPPTAGAPFPVLAAEAAALVRARQFAAAEALLARAAESVAPPAAAPGAPPDPLAREALPVVRAAGTVRRAIAAYLRDLSPPPSGRVLRNLRERAGGLTPAVIAAARERYLDEQRLAYTPEERRAYLGVLVDFAAAARDARRLELARLVLRPALALGPAATEATGDFAAEASLALGYARIAAGAGAPAEAYLAAEGVRRRCAQAPGGEWWRAAAGAALGIARVALGERDAGRRLAREALAELPPGHDDTRVDALRWLYAADLDASDADGALACHAALAALGEADGTSRREVEARAAERTAPEDAITRYRALLEDPREREPGGAFTADTAWRVVPRLGRLLLAAGHDGAAYHVLDFHYRPLLDARDADHPAASALDELLAELEVAAGRPEHALACLSRATARDSRLASRQLGVGTARERREMLAGPRRRADALVALAAECAAGDARAVGGTFAVALQRKGLNTNLEWQAARDAARAEGAPSARAPHVRALRRRQAAVRSAVAREALALARGVPNGGGPNGGGPNGGAGRLDALLQEGEALAAELTFLTGGLSAVDEHAEAPNPLSVAMCIPEGSAYVDYVRCRAPARPGADPPPARYAAFVVAARTMDWRLVDLGEAAPVDALVARWRAESTGEAEGVRDVRLDPEDDDDDGGPADPHTSAGAQLRALVFDPLLPALDGRTRLVVSPDGPLWGLPLECLTTDAGGHLVERYCVSYVSSVRPAAVMDADRAPGPPSPGHAPPWGDALVVGAPDYDLAPATAAGPAGERAAGFRFGPLPGTRTEAQAVAAAFGVAPALGAAATAERVRAARNPRAVHLATHGFALDATAAGGRLADAPLLRTGLALAGANAAPIDGGGEESDDAGVLTAAEVASLDLRATALVVLSACKTGLGEAEQGEGFASLGRSFEAAGARCVVVGLWSVPDAETCALMVAFYEHLAAGDGAAEALWRAKLAVRRRHPDVRRWGAFVCTGAWGPVPLRPPAPNAHPPAPARP